MMSWPMAYQRSMTWIASRRTPTGETSEGKCDGHCAKPMLWLARRLPHWMQECQ
jgi:hypothetical protein